MTITTIKHKTSQNVVTDLEIKLLKAIQFCVLQMGSGYGLFQTSYTKEHWGVGAWGKEGKKVNHKPTTAKIVNQTCKLDSDEA